jgi:hypothetical protein
MNKKVLIALAALFILGAGLVYAATSMNAKASGVKPMDNSERNRPF